MELINKRIIKRASKAIRCLPFNYNFYKDAQEKGLTAETVFIRKAQYKVKESRWFQSSYSVEATFRWLITIGILRREVDGQGLTSRVRLTPLGRQILEEKPDLPTQKAGFTEQLSNWLHSKWAL